MRMTENRMRVPGCWPRIQIWVSSQQTGNICQFCGFLGSDPEVW